MQSIKRKDKGKERADLILSRAMPLDLPIQKLPVKRLTRSEEGESSQAKKPSRSRGRPKKNFKEIPAAITPTTIATTAVVVSAVTENENAIGTTSETLPNPVPDEIDLALVYLKKTKKENIVSAYLPPLLGWREYCNTLVEGRFVDELYPYTVGPPEKVLAFFEEWVYVKTYVTSIRIGADVRTQISLRSEENPGTLANLIDLTKDAPLNKAGTGKNLEVPIGIEAVKQFKKALMALHDYQKMKRNITWPSPKVIKEIKDTIKKYERNLVYDQVQTNANRATHCVIRDSYKAGELIKILCGLWRSSDKFHLREMFSIASRHNMLLRDQDLRNLNYSDCFANIITQAQHRDSQQAVVLVFSLDKGKMLKDGEVRFACAPRHQNLFRCPFSAFAFYMFSKIQTMPFYNHSLAYMTWMQGFPPTP